MNGGIACLGLISCLILGIQGRESVEVSRDIVVKPTPNNLVNPEDKVNVTLNCTGSRTDLSFYIKNRMKWVFKGDDGVKKELSYGFYLSPPYSNSSKFALDYGEIPSGYFTALLISGVTRADNGVYKCSLLDESNTVIDSKSLSLTVVNPVETVSLEIHDANHKVIAQSNSPVTQGSKPVKISPGKYMVKCDAAGSNPEPVMNLFLNEEKPYVSVDYTEDTSKEFKSYKGSFSVMDLTINAHNSPQALVCSANIASNLPKYGAAKAGIALMVAIDRPNIACENATAASGDRNSKIKCLVSAQGNNDALLCDNISWFLGNKQQTIASDIRWKDPSKDYDIIESTCEKQADGLHVQLDLFTVSPVLFEETYFLVYGKDQNTHRHPVMLYDVTVNAADITTPLSLLASLVMAAFSRHLAQL